MWGSSRWRARRCSSGSASSSPARTSARSAATAAPPTLAWKTRRTPVTVPWTRTRPATEATRWELPVSDAANRSRSATSRTRPAAPASWPGVTACWPTTASLVAPACPTVTMPSGQHPSSHGPPAGWLSSWVAWTRSAVTTGRADSWSSRTTNQDGTAPKLANLTVNAPSWGEEVRVAVPLPTTRTVGPDSERLLLGHRILRAGATEPRHLLERARRRQRRTLIGTHRHLLSRQRLPASPAKCPRNSAESEMRISA